MAQLDLLSPIIHVPPILAQHDIPLPRPPMHVPHDALPPKAEGAYKTISEVSEEIDVPQHVLRFWESHFPQVKPSRMRGSRRYYRPADVELLKTIKSLLYSKGYTIKGAKQVVRGGKDAAQPETIAAAPVATASASSTAKTPAKKKNVDSQTLVSELRVLKSMLTSLL